MEGKWPAGPGMSAAGGLSGRKQGHSDARDGLGRPGASTRAGPGAALGSEMLQVLELWGFSSWPESLAGHKETLSWSH